MSVEPEFGNLGDGVARVRPSFPMRPGKTQRPLLPEDTLRRDRLFDCLAAGIHRRVTYVVAEAGFGKTTLVADFLRNSQIRTFWYRLDEDDTDGLVFLRYVVAACQAVDPRLLHSSASLLSDVAIEPRENVILQTLLGEIDCLGEVPSALVLDDFQFASSVPAIGTVVERLLSRSPDGLSLILIGRRTPSLAVAALRARGQLVELGREELRFDESETRRLFRESYTIRSNRTSCTKSRRARRAGPHRYSWSRRPSKAFRKIRSARSSIRYRAPKATSTTFWPRKSSASWMPSFATSSCG